MPVVGMLDLLRGSADGQLRRSGHRRVLAGSRPRTMGPLVPDLLPAGAVPVQGQGLAEAGRANCPGAARGNGGYTEPFRQLTSGKIAALDQP